ncbi:YozQ family protein [Bacillus sp. PS06]|uniref:YozQ family protein n=1 Tax=Bacillus sp. PS06 TaxID=2764176 RepID=UPI0017817B77|nr:YozQ family protein [Bacillus sp. PS06]MBD8071504.1 YozQ family protein [Bacillus sp. PS06]
MSKNNPQKSNELAGRYYQVDDYQNQDELASGLAMTHEQVSDSYMEGEIKAVIDDVNGKNIEVPREGYEQE